MRPLTDLLARNPLFARLSPADRTQLAVRALRRDYEKDEAVVERGQVWPYLLLVAQGTVAACKESSEGRSLIVTTLEPGDLFWGQAFFRDDAPNLVRLEARAPATLYLWPQDLLLPPLMQSPEALWALCRLQASRMEWASGVLEGFAFQPVAGRLARLLLSRFERAGVDRLPRDLTLDEMAAWAGTTREMACRTLYRLADQGLIGLSRAELTLHDEDGLRRLAERAL